MSGRPAGEPARLRCMQFPCLPRGTVCDRLAIPVPTDRIPPRKRPSKMQSTRRITENPPQGVFSSVPYARPRSASDALQPYYSGHNNHGRCRGHPASDKRPAYCKPRANIRWHDTCTRSAAAHTMVAPYRPPPSVCYRNYIQSSVVCMLQKLHTVKCCLYVARITCNQVLSVCCENCIQSDVLHTVTASTIFPSAQITAHAAITLFW